MATRRSRGLVMVVVVVVAIAALVAWWRWPRPAGPARPPSPSPGSPTVAGPAAVSAGSGGAAAADLTRVRRLAPDERRRLGEQIAAARRRAIARAAGADAGAAQAADGAGDPADVVIALEQVGGPLRAALEDAIPLLADCYQQAGGGAAARDAMARMTMISDPELGTVIDTEQVTGADGAPLPAALDECLRDRIDALALPPLGAGGRLPLQYTFTFDDDDADADGDGLPGER